MGTARRGVRAVPRGPCAPGGHRPRDRRARDRTGPAGRSLRVPRLLEGRRGAVMGGGLPGRACRGGRRSDETPRDRTDTGGGRAGGARLAGPPRTPLSGRRRDAVDLQLSALPGFPWVAASLLTAGYLSNLSLIHISEPTRRTPNSYAVFCLKKKKNYIAIAASK